MLSTKEIIQKEIMNNPAADIKNILIKEPNTYTKALRYMVRGNFRMTPQEVKLAHFLKTHKHTEMSEEQRETMLHAYKRARNKKGKTGHFNKSYNFMSKTVNTNKKKGVKVNINF